MPQRQAYKIDRLNIKTEHSTMETKTEIILSKMNSKSEYAVSAFRVVSGVAVTILIYTVYDHGSFRGIALTRLRSARGLCAFFLKNGTENGTEQWESYKPFHLRQGLLSMNINF